MRDQLIRSEKLSAFTDKSGQKLIDSIAVKEYVNINGSKQGMFIEGTDINQPVLLFLHGGPGLSLYPLIKKDQMELHKYFTVCYWEQRGTGISYHHTMTSTPPSLEQLIADTIAVTDYLIEKFGKKRVYLFGHSWGTFLGSIVATRFPERFHAYIGAGQIGKQTESEKETLEFLLQKAIKGKDKKAQAQIRGIHIDESFYKNKQYGQVNRKYLLRYGGGMKRNVFSYVKMLAAYLFCEGYTLSERINILNGERYSYPLMRELAENDLLELAPEFQIPVFIIHGRHDYQTTHKQAKQYFDTVKAPVKRFYTFEKSAHTPFLEEKELFYRIIEADILNRSN